MSNTSNKLTGKNSQLPGLHGAIQLYVHGELQGEFPVGAAPLNVGRSMDCDIVLADSAISKRHARIAASERGVVVKDLGSAHGIVVDGRPQQEHEISSKGSFSILQYQFRYLSGNDYRLEKSRGGEGLATGRPTGRAAIPGAHSAAYAPGENYGMPDNYGTLPDEPNFLAEILGVIRERWRLIALLAVAAVVLGFIHNFLTKPAFETNAVVQVEPKIREIGGPFSDTDDSRKVNDALIDEVQILQSRSVLGQVVDDLSLSIKANPSYFPVIGAAIARIRSGSDGLREPLFGLTGYAWSDESVKVDSMDIPERFIDQKFVIVSGANGAYQVSDSEGRRLATGQVGEPLSGWLPSDEPSSLFVSKLIANRGTEFILTKLPRLEAINSLRDSLGISDAGVDSSILRLSLTGTSPTGIAEIVNNVVSTYVMRNVQQQSEEATRTLQFVENQIPIAKEKLEIAESKLSELRLQRGSVDLSSDTQVVLEKIVRLESQLSELRTTRAQLVERFTPQHPRVRSLDAQLVDLGQELVVAEAQVKELPTTEREVLSVSREVAVASELYVNLVNRAQELQVVSAYAATKGNVRVVDYASVPLLPFKPNRPLILAMYLILGLIAAGGIIMFERQLTNAVRDPELIEAKLNLPIYATLSHSSHQASLNGRESGAKPILAISNPADMAIEGMRSLRTSLQFAFVNAENNILLITAPSAQVGKTFVASNLAVVLASSGRSVIVIDADLRRGTLHQQFGLSREPGLADSIGGDVELAKVAHTTDFQGLSVITAGAIPPNPSELLMHDRFFAQLNSLSKEYDHVIIDSPPVLAVTDAALLSRLAGVVLLVVKCGGHSMRQIEQSVKQLTRVGANVRGIVFNEVPEYAGKAYGKHLYREYKG